MTNPIAPLTFGVDLTAVHARFDALEARMTAVDNILTSTDDKLGQILAGFNDFSADLAALVASLGTLTPEQQVLADRIDERLGTIAGALSAADSAVGDRDGSDTPLPVEEPEEPTAPADPEAPVEG